MPTIEEIDQQSSTEELSISDTYTLLNQILDQINNGQIPEEEIGKKRTEVTQLAARYQQKIIDISRDAVSDYEGPDDPEYKDYCQELFAASEDDFGALFAKLAQAGIVLGGSSESKEEVGAASADAAQLAEQVAAQLEPIKIELTTLREEGVQLRLDKQELEKQLVEARQLAP